VGESPIVDAEPVATGDEDQGEQESTTVEEPARRGGRKRKATGQRGGRTTTKAAKAAKPRARKNARGKTEAAG
jgi:hypothetical protein